MDTKWVPRQSDIKGHIDTCPCTSIASCWCHNIETLSTWPVFYEDMRKTNQLLMSPLTKEHNMNSFFLLLSCTRLNKQSKCWKFGKAWDSYNVIVFMLHCGSWGLVSTWRAYLLIWVNTSFLITSAERMQSNLKDIDYYQIDGLEQERRNSIANALELCLSCTNPSKYRTALTSAGYRSGVGVTKPISSIPLFSKFFNIIKTHVSYWISRLYLTGVAAAQLRWHLSNIDVFWII